MNRVLAGLAGLWIVAITATVFAAADGDRQTLFGAILPYDKRNDHLLYRQTHAKAFVNQLLYKAELTAWNVTPDMTVDTAAVFFFTGVNRYDLVIERKSGKGIILQRRRNDTFSGKIQSSYVGVGPAYRVNVLTSPELIGHFQAEDFNLSAIDNETYEGLLDLRQQQLSSFNLRFRMTRFIVTRDTSLQGYIYGDRPSCLINDQTGSSILRYLYPHIVAKDDLKTYRDEVYNRIIISEGKRSYYYYLFADAPLPIWNAMTYLYVADLKVALQTQAPEACRELTDEIKLFLGLKSNVTLDKKAYYIERCDEVLALVHKMYSSEELQLLHPKHN